MSPLYHRSGERAPVSPVILAWDALPGLFPALGSPGRWLPLLQRHAAIIEESATHTRVTAVPTAEAVRRQYAESLELLRIARDLGAALQPVIDVGSGGGFPGLVFAIVEPDTAITLVEPLRKRARLLEGMAAELELPNVRVVAARAEEAARGPLRDSAALVTARAVAELRELLEYTAPFARPGGWLLLPKGSTASSELAAATAALAELQCAHRASIPMRPEVSETLTVLAMEKLGATSPTYPRRPGTPAKRPL